MKEITATMLTAFIGLICIVMQGCSVPRNQPPLYQSKMVYDRGESTLYTIEPSRLILEFVSSNKVAVYQRYMGKRIAIEGPIGAIDVLSNGDPALTFYDYYSHYIGLITCQFSKAFTNDMAQMSSGKNVIVIGTVSDHTSTRKKDIIYLKDCILAQPALF